jgi:hypothetical protein
MKRRLTIDLDIDLNGALDEDIDWILSKCAEHLYANGLLTGTSDAEINKWDYKITDPDVPD